MFCATAASECDGDALGAEAQRRRDGKERAGRLGVQRQLHSARAGRLGVQRQLHKDARLHSR